MAQRGVRNAASQPRSTSNSSSGDVVEERVAAVEQPRDAAGLDVRGQALVLFVVHRPRGIGAPGQRRHREHAGQIVKGDGAGFH